MLSNVKQKKFSEILFRESFKKMYISKSQFKKELIVSYYKQYFKDIIAFFKKHEKKIKESIKDANSLEDYGWAFESFWGKREIDKNLDKFFLNVVFNSNFLKNNKNIDVWEITSDKVLYKNYICFCYAVRMVFLSIFYKREI